MKFNKLLKYLFFLNFLLNSNLLADNNYFAEGQVLFIKKEFAKAKFKFEQDLVYNPKSEKSYLYLSFNSFFLIYTTYDILFTDYWIVFWFQVLLRFMI